MAIPSQATGTDGQQAGSSRLPANVKLLGWVSCINDVASEMVYPLLPQFLISVLGGNRFYLGLIEGAAESASSLLKLASGAWSDRLRRRKGLVVFGYSLSAVARPLIGLTVAPWQLLVCRFGDRVGKGARTSPRDALIADSTPESMRGRAFGFHRAMDHLGAAVGPLLATAYLAVWPGQLRMLFLLTLLPGLIVVVLLVGGLHSPPASGRPAETGPPAKERHDGSFRLFLVALVLFTLGNSSDTFLMVRAGELGVATVWLPMLWFVIHVVKSGGNLLAGSAVDRWGARLPLVIGWLLYAAVYLAFGLAGSAWQVWPIFVAYGMFYALSEPAEKTLVTQLAGPQRKGLAFGWFHCAVGIAALPSSLVFGALYEQFGALAAFGFGAASALFAAALLCLVRPQAG